MPISYRKGDLFGPLLASTGPVVVPHVCNDMGAWGAGFVVPLGRTFPNVREDYIQWAARRQPGPDFALGEVRYVEARNNPLIVVANMVAQDGVGGLRPLRYWALAQCLERVAGMTLAMNATIVCPMFGAGLAGGDWRFIAQLIDESWLWRKIDVTIYYLEGMLPFDDEDELDRIHRWP